MSVTGAERSANLYPDTASWRVLKGVGANFVGQLLNLGSRVLLVPLFLRVWGAQVYGEWLVLSSLAMYLSLTDLGAQLYVVNRLTQAYAHRDVTLFRRVLHSGFTLFLFLPGFMFVLFLLAIWLVSPERFLQISNTPSAQARWVLCLLALQFVVSLPQGLLLGVYRSVGMLPRGVMMANLMQLLQFLFIAGGLMAGGGMMLIALLQLAPVLIVGAAASWHLQSLFPQFGVLSLSHARLSTIKEFIKPSLHFLLIQVSQACSIQGMVVVVGAVLAPVQVVIFFTLRTMTNLMRQLLAMLTQAVWPEITRLDAIANSDKLWLLFRALLRSTMILASLVAALLHFFGGSVYGLWIGKSVEYQQVTMDLLLVYALQLIFWTACRNVLMATNAHHRLSRLLAASAALGLVLAYVGGKRMGLTGVVAGMLVADLLLPFWAVPYLLSSRHEKFSLSFYAREILPVGAGLAVMIMVPPASPVVIVALLAWGLRCLSGATLVWRTRRLEGATCRSG